MKKQENNLIKNRRIYNGLLIIIFTTILFFITIHKLETSKIDIKLGDRVAEDIRATKDLEDTTTTKRLKREAINKVEPRYRINPSVQMTMKGKIKDFLESIRKTKSEENIKIDEKIKSLEKTQEFKLSKGEISFLLKMDYENLNKFENNLMDLINQLMGAGIKESELKYEKENLENVFEFLNMKTEEKNIGFKLIESTMDANLFFDKEATNRRKVEAENSIEPLILKENEIIAEQGTIIGRRELALIKESGLLKDDGKIPLDRIFGITNMILLGMIIIGLYIYYFNKDILYNNRLLILLIIVSSIIIISRSLHLISPYIMPISAVALLISMLIDSRLALIINFFLILFLGFLLKLDTNAIAMYIVGGSIGIILDKKQEQRYNVFINGIIIALINIISLVSFGLAKGVGFTNALNGTGYGFLSGIISGVLTLGTLPIWENVFNVLTPLKLLELSNPNQELLKKILLEAPGTYHHSILVGNLSEAAAEAIGADPLISRVGSYYHDVGKIIRPYYFAENQFGMENPHDKLKPRESAKIILSHRLDGIELARKYKIPKEIIDIIDQHHGTTKVSYFYHKEKELNQDRHISIEDFQYKGKKPQTKEAAIVMMADSSEAAVRSIKGLTREKIEDMVRKVVKGKISDGQFEECNITLLEIELAINSFINVLSGIYHDRIEYPNDKKIIEVRD